MLLLRQWHAVAGDIGNVLYVPSRGGSPRVDVKALRDLFAVFFIVGGGF